MTQKLFKTLIIDDEWLVRVELKRMLLQYSNIEVVGEAANLDEAINLYRELKPELIFLDIQLPGGTGFDFLDEVTGNYKVVFVTAFGGLHEAAKKYHAAGFLMKPISKLKLADVIQKLSGEIPGRI